jgi:hypothetical protein
MVQTARQETSADGALPSVARRKTFGIVPRTKLRAAFFNFGTTNLPCSSSTIRAAAMPAPSWRLSGPGSEAGSPPRRTPSSSCSYMAGSTTRGPTTLIFRPFKGYLKDRKARSGSVKMDWGRCPVGSWSPGWLARHVALRSFWPFRQYNFWDRQESGRRVLTGWYENFLADSGTTITIARTKAARPSSSSSGTVSEA